MSISGISLRQLVEVYMKSGKNLGFSDVDLCLELLETRQDVEFKEYSLWIQKACESIHRLYDNQDLKPKLDIVTYCSMMEKIFKKQSDRTIPRNDFLTLSYIAFTIHQKQYKDVEDFLEILERNFGIESSYSEIKILGNLIGKLHPGLQNFISSYFEKSEKALWISRSKEDRLNALEKAETKMYTEITREWKKLDHRF